MRCALLFVAIAAALGAACGPPPASEPPAPAPIVTSEADVASGSATLHLWTRGGSDGADVLVLINGGPGLSHESMDPLQVALASPSLEVVTYDQRGVGRSIATDTTPFTVDEYLADLDAIRRFVHRDRIHLLGHSFGGMVSLAYLDRAPAHVASVVLVSTGVADAAAMTSGGEAFTARVAELQAQGLVPATLSTDCHERLLSLLPAYFADPRHPTPESMKRRSCDATKRSDVIDEWIDATYTRGGVAHTALPVLILRGDHEVFGAAPSEAAARALVAAHPSVVALPECGHLGWLECPDAFLAEVRPFLAAHPAHAKR